MSSQSSEDRIGPAIVRVLADAGTAEDHAALRTWLAGDPDRQRELERLRAVWQESGALQRGWDTAALQRRILQAVEDKVMAIRSGRPAPRLHSRTELVLNRRGSWLPALAAAALLVTLGTLIWRLGALPAEPLAVGTAALTEVATERGQRAELYLSDGTRITLGVASRLRYPERFATGTSRDVQLRGEAYFEVAGDTLRPFVVHAGAAVTRVLGTRFAVRAYAEDRAVQVVVAEGKVALASRSGGDVILRGGDLGELETGGRPAVRHGVDVSGQLAWVDGRLVFVDTPLDEVVRRLSRWYDLDVRLGELSLADYPYTMSLRGNESPEHVLRTIAAAVGARLERRGTAYVILSPREVR